MSLHISGEIQRIGVCGWHPRLAWQMRGAVTDGAAIFAFPKVSCALPRTRRRENPMRQKTVLATLVTITFLVGSVFTTVVALAVAAQLELPIALAVSVGVTCLWSLLM